MDRRIIILGGGFAGLAALEALRGRPGLAVTLIDARAENVYAPLLPDLISGTLRPEHVCHDLREHCQRRGAQFLCERVTAVDAADRRVVTESSNYSADAVIVALGSVTNYFGRDDLAVSAPGLKSPGEARRLARRALDAVVAGTPATLVVVGGGYTGFEAAGHLALLLHRRLGLDYAHLAERARILIVEKADEPLANIDAALRRRTVDYIRTFGVELRCGASLESITPEGRASLTDGECFDNARAVWTAGVTAPPVARTLDGAELIFGRLKVDDCLRVAGCEGIYAAGDLAAPRPGGAERPLRMGVQFSLAGGRAAARNALADLSGAAAKPFDPYDPGYVVPLAPGRAAGRIMGVRLTGRLPLALHYLMCMYRAWSMSQRLGVLGDLIKRPGVDISTSQCDEVNNERQ